MTEKKSKKDTKKSVSDTPNEEVAISPEINGGRTIILRDPLGELVLSSTHEEDSFEKMLNIANKQKERQKLNSQAPLPPGPRSYHG